MHGGTARRPAAVTHRSHARAGCVPPVVLPRRGPIAYGLAEPENDGGQMNRSQDLGVAMIGHAFMGAAHSQAWRTAHRVFDLPLTPAMRVLCGRDADRTAESARRMGWDEAATDWRAVIERDDIDLVDVCTPGDSHAEIAIAALEAGKHVLCEKPLANTADEATAMAEAAERARSNGVRAMVGFNYRRVPAMALARQWIAEGRLGTIRQVRAAYLQDWIADPEFPLVWRLQREHAGSGSLGDIGSHIVDLSQYLLGEQLVGVTALTETFVKERPLTDGSGRGPVTVDDCAIFAGRFAGGAIGTFEATRFATGRKNALRLEVNGSDGSIAFDLEALNELQYHDAREPAASAGFRRVLVTEPEHPYMSAWWPPGHVIGWEHTFSHEVADLVRAIAAGEDPAPGFTEGLHVQRVLAAVEDSAASDCRWTAVDAGTGVAG
jgi:predicted dehydrogenase